MASHHELMRTIEEPSPSGREYERARSSLDTAQIDSLLARQADMLVSIERDIGTTLFETLCAKIESEREFLLKNAAKVAKSAQANEQLNRTLNAERFTRRRLDANIL